MKRKKKFGWNILTLCVVASMTLGLVLSLGASGFGMETVHGDETEYEHELVSGYFTTMAYEGSSGQTSIELEHENDDDHSYEWSYSGGQWTGDTDLLMEDDTWFADGEWSVRVAVEHDAPTGDEWMLIIDNEERSVFVAEPDTPSALMGSLRFLLEPYEDEAQDTSSITVPNRGNVPLTYEINYDSDDFIGELSDEASSERLQPGARENVDFTYIKNTDGPERDIISNVDAKNIILTVYYMGELDREADGNVVIGAERRLTVNGVVEVGYEGYEREFGDDYDIQYKDSVEVDGLTENTVTYYIYPHEEVNLIVRNEGLENVTVEEITIDGDTTLDVGSLERLSPDEEEVMVEITFESHYRYDGEITLTADGDRYTTLVEIDQPAPEPESEDENPLEGQERVITGIVVFGIIIGFMGVRHWKDSKAS